MRDTFASHRFPVMSTDADVMPRLRPPTVSALRISRTLLLEVSHHLPPFALCATLSHSDYYGGSVALDLAVGRRSHIP